MNIETPSWFQSIVNWFSASFAAIKQFILSCFNTMFDMFKDLLYWTVDVLMGFAAGIANTLGEGLDFNPAQYFSAIPSDVQNILGLIGLGEALAMITTSIVIRMLLQLIPFVRLGS